MCGAASRSRPRRTAMRRRRGMGSQSQELERNVGTLLNGAFTLAVIKDVAEAKKMADAARGRPEASIEEVEIGLRLCDAMIAMRRGDRGAIDAMPVPKEDYTDGQMGLIFTIGVANLEQGSADIAARRFKQILDWRSPAISALAALAPLYYGRALMKLGKADEGRKAYDQFFELMKNADANLPVLLTARQEYARQF